MIDGKVDYLPSSQQIVQLGKNNADTTTTATYLIDFLCFLYFVNIIEKKFTAKKF